MEKPEADKQSPTRDKKKPDAGNKGGRKSASGSKTNVETPESLDPVPVEPEQYWPVSIF